ncbi:MAG: SH3 domain-containing protein, partial [Firmicutes bacterium]|nr:SH3 domain-containing protein [Bacillota bacterium]
MIFGRVKKSIAMLIALALVITVMPQQSLAKVIYLPDVTSEMSAASYWSDKMDDPEKTLVTMDDIKAINKSIEDASGTNVGDLSTFPQTEFDSEAAAQALYNSAVSDAEYFFGSPNYARYDGYGNGYSTWDAAWEGMYRAMAENCIDDEASGMKPVQYAICTKRTNVLSFPSTERILDDRDDPDFDYQYQSPVRVGEPVIIKARSKDHRFYSAVTTCTSGWIPAEDIAICSDKDEWLGAWKFGSDETLVVYDDKVFTEDSNSAPDTANVKLSMGTCLKLAKESEWTGLITNRSAHNNHVVWLPIRDSNGKYDKKLALVSEHL